MNDPRSVATANATYLVLQLILVGLVKNEVIQKAPTIEALDALILMMDMHPQRSTEQQTILRGMLADLLDNVRLARTGGATNAP